MGILSPNSPDTCHSNRPVSYVLCEGETIGCRWRPLYAASRLKTDSCWDKNTGEQRRMPVAHDPKFGCDKTLVLQEISLSDCDSLRGRRNQTRPIVAKGGLRPKILWVEKRQRRETANLPFSDEARDVMTDTAVAPYEVEVFFDGGCPLCAREIAMLKRWDRRHKIRFTDIDAAEFRAEDVGKTQDELMAQLCGRLPDGTWIRGVEVFRRLYTAVGFGPLVFLSRLPVISQTMDLGYVLFARNRLRLTGRCTTKSCEVKQTPKTPDLVTKSPS